MSLLQKFLSFSYKKYEHSFIMRDLNITRENTHLNDLLQIYDLTSLINEPTCYQSQNLSYLEQLLTNQKVLFKHFQFLGLVSQIITNFEIFMS